MYSPELMRHIISQTHHLALEQVGSSRALTQWQATAHLILGGKAGPDQRLSAQPTIGRGLTREEAIEDLFLELRNVWGIEAGVLQVVSRAPKERLLGELLIEECTTYVEEAESATIFQQHSMAKAILKALEHISVLSTSRKQHIRLAAVDLLERCILLIRDSAELLSDESEISNSSSS